MDEEILEGLNPEQSEAVQTVRGPVCILAGAGSGKTTTITRRIAYQIREGAFLPREILAVTFTDKAAKEMGERLSRLGANTVKARTFHSEALAQYRRFGAKDDEILASKVPVLKSLVSSLPPPHRFVSPRDVATEIEWAKNRRIGPAAYPTCLADHIPPLPPIRMAALYAEYERRKQRAKLLDFEDLLERTVQLLRDDDAALEQVRGTYRAFTVDEYQDVNLLQQSLLDAWLGERSDVCVVGDDFQSIYAFSGADPRYLLDFPTRYPGCKTIGLTLNYRSTPDILTAANRLGGKLEGSSKMLRPTLPSGAPVRLQTFEHGWEEAAWMADQVKQLRTGGVEWEQIAVLLRINARSEAYEQAFSRAGIPYQVADSPFLRRTAARTVITKLRRSGGGDVASTVEHIARSMGYKPEDPSQVSGEEATRLADLERLVLLAREYDGTGGILGYLDDLAERFSEQGHGQGVQLLTIHKAKGKEYQVVFLPRLEERELPFALAQSAERLDEERRLFYVGMTRAKQHLYLSCAGHREGERPIRREPSRFLREMGMIRSSAAGDDRQNGSPASAKAKRPSSVELSDAPPALLSALKEWRKKVFMEKGVPAYIIFWDSTLAAIAERRPATIAELLAVSGVGPSKVEAFGDDVLAVVREFKSAEANA